MSTPERSPSLRPPTLAVAALAGAMAMVLLVPVVAPRAQVQLVVLTVFLACVAAASLLRKVMPRAAVLVAVAAVLWCTGWALAGLPPRVDARFLAATAVAVLVPLVAASAWFRRRTELARLAVEWRRLAVPATTSRVRTALASLMEDPGLTLYYQRIGAPGWVTDTGENLHELPGDDRRVHHEARTPDGETLAVLSLAVPPRVSAHRRDAILALGALAIDSARLQAVLRAQLLELRDSRARIVRAAVEERHRLARDLHDGAQQHLLVLSTRLGQLQMLAAGSAAATTEVAVREARQQLQAALADVRNLSREVYPAALDTDGFEAALEAMGERLGIVVLVEGEPVTCDRDMQVVAYWTINDIALALPEQADGLRVRASSTPAHLVLTIDAVPPAARPQGDEGQSLTIAVDRIAAIGGVMTVRSAFGGSDASSAAGRGESSWVEVTLPFE